LLSCTTNVFFWHINGIAYLFFGLVVFSFWPPISQLTQRVCLFWIILKKKLYFSLKKSHFLFSSVCLGFLEKLFYQKNLF